MVDRTLSLGIEIFFLIEYLAPLTIETRIRFLIDVSFVRKLLPDSLRCRPVPNLVGRPNKIIGGGRKSGSEFLKKSYVLIEHALRVLSELFGLVVNLGAMLIGTRKEKGVIPPRTIIASQYIGDNKLHSMTHVRSCIHVWDRSCNKAMLHNKYGYEKNGLYIIF